MDDNDDFEIMKGFAFAFGLLAISMLLGALLAAIALWLFPALWRVMFM